MAGKFEVYKDARGKYRFRLKSGNGQIIAVGEAYESMAACLAGIESIRGTAPAATVADMTAMGAQTKAGAGAKASAGAGAGSKGAMHH
jgi:uncharacterized protein YegP (UPF0339 family)